MPTLIHMVVCREVVVDQSTNNVSLHGVIEEIQVPTEAFEVAKNQKVMAAGSITVYALLSWEWPASEPFSAPKVELRLCNPSGNMIAISATQIAPDPSPRLRTIFSLPGFPLDGEGIYTFELYADHRLLGRVPFKVVKQESVSASQMTMPGMAALT